MLSKTKRRALAAGLTFLMALVITPPAHAQSDDARAERGQVVISELSAGAGQPVLETMRREVPQLGDAILKYALGDVFGSGVLDIRTRQIAAVAAFAAQGQLAYLRIHAGYALNHSVTPQELLDVALLTSVTAGFPRAIDAAQALRELFAERGIAMPVSNP